MMLRPFASLAHPAANVATTVACLFSLHTLLAEPLRRRRAARTRHKQTARVSSNVPFVVGEIRIEGLQRITEGTVFNYLPINIGDALDSRRPAKPCGRSTAPDFSRTWRCVATAAC